MKQDNAAFRKRNQISQASRLMFVWIAIASVLVGAAIVVSFFLFQKLVYGEKVLAEKQNTVKTLDGNLAVVNGLKTEVQALDVNENLLSIKANDTDEALQVVLDALPSDANSLALGASLQTKLLANIEGDFQLESLQVIPVEGVENITDQSTVDASAAVSDNNIAFSFSATGSQESLKKALENLEKSIRTIVITRLGMEVQGDKLTISVDGHAFYQPAKTIELKDKKVEH